MKDIKDYLLIILIAFFAIWVYTELNKTYKPVDFSDTSKFVKVKEVHDTTYKKVYINTYKKGNDIPFYIIDSLIVPIHDTIRIISDYNRIYAYSDTIKKDSNIFVIDDTISQNRIISRGFTAKLTEKTIYIKEYYAQKAKFGLYYGIRGDFSQDNGLEVLSPGLMLNAKNKALIGLNVNINKNYNISYSGSIYFKIGKK
jgi:hypothetical protein